MVSEPVLYSADGRVATITLNRAEAMNTITGAMLDALADALLCAQRDTAVRAVILTGAGRTFCAGLDTSTAPRTDGRGATGSAASSPIGIDPALTPPTILHAMDKPVIAALNGAAAGYGFDLALGCDIRLMAAGAKLACAFTKRGVLPESGATWILPRLLGWSSAAELIFTGRTLSAAEAADLGLVSEVLEADSLMPRAARLAAEIANNAPLAVQAAKRAMRQGLSEDFPAHVQRVYLQLLPLLRSADFKEGMAAFREKREPVFTGE